MRNEIRGIQTVEQVHLLSGEDGMRNEMRGIQTIDLVHIRTGDGRRALHEASVNKLK
jgi:hypothetical protein